MFAIGPQNPRPASTVPGRSSFPCGHVAGTIPEWASRHGRLYFLRIDSGSVDFPGNKATAARRYFSSRNARAAAMAACRWLIPDLYDGSICA